MKAITRKQWQWLRGLKGNAMRDFMIQGTPGLHRPKKKKTKGRKADPHPSPFSMQTDFSSERRTNFITSTNLPPRFYPTRKAK